jgi:YfiH family protein
MWRVVAALSPQKTKLKDLALKRTEWPLQEIGGLPLLIAPALANLPGVVHAFTTRLGGLSEPPLDSFNLGRHRDDEKSRQDAMVNRSALCDALAVDFTRLVVPGQVHSTNIVLVANPESLPEVDGVATLTPATPVLLHYADCVPIILVERELKVVCVLHAGWRGTAGGIARHAVEFLRKKVNAKPGNMVAAIGPAIGPCCYPVSQDVVDQLANTVDSLDGLVEQRNGQPAPDLKAINALQLLESGAGEVEINSYCTACHPELFYSHRYSNGKTGRQGALVSLSNQ